MTDPTAALATSAQLVPATSACAPAAVTTAAPAAPATGGTTFASLLAASAPQSPTSAASAATGAGAYMPLISQAAARYGIDPALLYGLISQESAFNPNAVSSAGAEGLTQIMPENFASLGITDPFDPAQSINGGAQMLAENLRTFGGNTVDALAAYNAGVGAVERYGGVPPYPETQNYVQQVLGYAAQYPGAAEGGAYASAAVPTAAPSAAYGTAAPAGYAAASSPATSTTSSTSSSQTAVLDALYSILSSEASQSSGADAGSLDPSATLATLLPTLLQTSGTTA